MQHRLPVEPVVEGALAGLEAGRPGANQGTAEPLGKLSCQRQLRDPHLVLGVERLEALRVAGHAGRRAL